MKKDDKKEKSKTDRKESESISNRKRKKQESKKNRWSGLMLFLILLLIGFVLWVSGEVRDKTRDKVGGGNDREYIEMQDDVIIIE